METNLQVFYNEESNVNIRMEEVNNQPWFIAKDVCTALELSDVSMTVKRLEEDEKLIQTVLVSGQGREMWFINESGLYNLIFQSRKPEARAFRKWVTNEVLPLHPSHRSIPDQGRGGVHTGATTTQAPAPSEIPSLLCRMEGTCEALYQSV